MKAVAFERSLPISDADALIDCELPRPEASGYDLLVEIKAIAVNPVDCKIRKIAPPASGQKKVLGWDACGVVVAVGDKVSQFKEGDEVFYAGDLTRQGSNAEYQLVDERIVGRKPKSIDFAQAAALPLTTLTAWELLFDRLALSENRDGQILLVTAAAGGVGSILIQLAKQLTQATVIGTASRDASIKWVEGLGADLVINHHEDLMSQLSDQGIQAVSHVASLLHTDTHYPALIEALAPQGKFGLIDDPESLDICAFKKKSLSLHWEFMYTRSMFTTDDMARQGEILNHLSELVDEGRIKTTFGANMGKICAANLIEAHRRIESQQTIGKLVLEGF